MTRNAQHTPPTRSVVAFCPDCISYGSPMGKDDRQCGNCNKTNCRIYEELPEPQAQSVEADQPQQPTAREMLEEIKHVHETTYTGDCNFQRPKTDIEKLIERLEQWLKEKEGR